MNLSRPIAGAMNTLFYGTGMYLFGSMLGSAGSQTFQDNLATPEYIGAAFISGLTYAALTDITRYTPLARRLRAEKKLAVPERDYITNAYARQVGQAGFETQSARANEFLEQMVGYIDKMNPEVLAILKPTGYQINAMKALVTSERVIYHAGCVPGPQAQLISTCMGVEAAKASTAAKRALRQMLTSLPFSKKFREANASLEQALTVPLSVPEDIRLCWQNDAPVPYSVVVNHLGVTAGVSVPLEFFFTQVPPEALQEEDVPRTLLGIMDTTKNTIKEVTIYDGGRRVYMDIPSNPRRRPNMSLRREFSYLGQFDDTTHIYGSNYMHNLQVEREEATGGLGQTRESES